MNCPKPQCKGTIKKIKTQEGHYYRCTSCGYKTQLIKRKSYALQTRLFRSQIVG
jgi:DNA-directed RNA polymerase subunit RPC12/RpoP